MSSVQYATLKPGTVIYGFHKGSHFACTVVSINENQSVTVRYASGTQRNWSKTHIKKYYSRVSMQALTPYDN